MHIFKKWNNKMCQVRRLAFYRYSKSLRPTAYIPE
jgi:hypothetical protein